MKLLGLAKQYDFVLVEDDYDYDFHYDNQPILPLASYRPSENLVYVGSFSKLLVPSIRQGFMVAPPHLLADLTLQRRYIDRCGDPLVERSMAALITSGLIGRHLRKSMRTYKKRRDLFTMLLQQELAGYVHFTKPNGGMAIWAEFDACVDVIKLCEDCLRDGLYLASPNDYNQPDLQTTRLGFASMDEQQHLRAFEILKKNVFRQVK